MSYPITIDLIPGLPQKPFIDGVGGFRGVCCHSTDDKGASAKNEDNFFHNNWQSDDAFVDGIVGWDAIIQNTNLLYQSWGCANGNPYFVNVELCETDDPALFQKSYAMYVWYVAKILADKKIPPIDGVTLVSHDWVSKNMGGTNHSDPIQYLSSHGVTWAQHVANVQAEYNRQTMAAVPPAPQPIGVAKVITPVGVVRRSGAGINFPRLNVLPYGSSWLVWAHVNGRYNVGGWIPDDPAWVQFTPR
jgi:N-acetylmuramoyl-L-alanine amidase CwlA